MLRKIWRRWIGKHIVEGEQPPVQQTEAFGFHISGAEDVLEEVPDVGDHRNHATEEETAEVQDIEVQTEEDVSSQQVELDRAKVDLFALSEKVDAALYEVDQLQKDIDNMKIALNNMQWELISVQEICTAASAAFLKLGELSMMLHSLGEPSPSGSPVKIVLKRESLDDATIMKNVALHSTPKSADITLNMLNAMEPEVDVEGLTGANKLDYDSPDAS